ncbi:MAG TPA: hypothetical protein VGN72_06965 [Tepidisphaeraceae bacterium]|jgi:hypothetical protein|nr:hypothetical protein [Tepidisphaeraceae bacterium]
MRFSHLLGVVVIGVGTMAVVVEAQVAQQGIRRRIGNAVAARGTVNLPHLLPDKTGNQWQIYQNGWFRQQGNVPVYSQGGQLIVNGNNPNMTNNIAKVDAETGEIVLENMQANAISVTRRIKVNEEDGSLRIIDIFTGQGGAQEQVNVSLQTSVNFGVQSAQTVNDPKDKGKVIGWAAMTHGNRAAMEWFGGAAGAEVEPTVNWQQGNNTVSAAYALTIPAGKPVAIVHVHQTAVSQQAAVGLIEEIDARALLSDVPKEIRRAIVNVRTVAPLLADLELLRGEALDVVELRNGDRVTGTLVDKSFSLKAPFGQIDVPIDTVLGAFNIGQYRPRQLVVTTDGQVLGGALAKETIELSLPGGQMTAIPLRQVSRIGMRKRTNEAEEVQLTQPHAVLREGDRVAIAAPTSPLSFATRYGTVEVPAAAVAAVMFQDEESPVHVVRLTDGTSLSGLVTTPELDVTLANGSAVKLPVANMLALNIVPGELPEVIKDETPVLRTLGNDALVGTLSGQLELVTAFDVLKLDASTVRGLSRGKGFSSDVQLTTWDGATLSGQLANDRLTLQLTSGIALEVPVSLLASYEQPRPQASATVVDQIKTIVADLNAEDWKQRDLAEAQLVAMGPSIAAALRQLRTSQPAEVQQRIDSIVKQVEEKK